MDGIKKLSPTDSKCDLVQNRKLRRARQGHPFCVPPS